ncbi:hypothetical protein F5Y11DRAFT_362578 [Daldinia sp. FL1419]|nr:hypothetical protein F5Y11DRAFT_362578 [Daldinia sp. FL1419]
MDNQNISSPPTTASTPGGGHTPPTMMDKDLTSRPSEFLAINTASRASAEYISPPLETTPEDKDTAGETTSIAVTKPENQEPRVPRITVVYSKNCPCGLYSIYDRENRKYVYRYDGDDNGSLQLSFVEGKITMIQNYITGENVYIRGVTHKDTN